MSDIIDINVYETTEDVTINVTESVIEVNINQVSSGSIGAWGSIIGDIADQTDLQNALDLKVDKVAGKELSENDFTDILKTKLDGISPGAEVNVNADWNSVSGDSEILNKPTIPSIEGLATVTYVDDQDDLKEDDLGNPLVDGYVLASTIAGVRSWVEQSGGGGGGTWGSITGELSDQVDLQSALDNKVDKVVGKELSTNDFTDALETKLNGIEAGAEVNVNSDWNAISGDAQILNKPTIPTQGLTSVALTMPPAFSVANSPLIADGTLAVTAAGTASQYIRGDGQLATLPTSGGGGSSVFYYLNGSVAASVATYKQMDNTAVIGAGTDFPLTGNGLIAQFLTDAGNPNRLLIPSGAWNFEMFFSMSSGGGTPKFYVELLKYNGTTFTSIASSSAVPETINGGTTIDLYLTSLAVPETTLLLTDRLSIRVYIVGNSGGRTATLHTENSHICQIITTFAAGVSAINGLTSNNQYLAVGTTGTDFNINSVSETHTFNLPTASALNRGALSSANWSTFNGKQDALGYTPENQANKEDVVLDTSAIKYPTNNLVKTNIDLKANIASPTFTGTVTTPAIIVSSETINTIASFDGSKNIKSLPTASYPDLTELSYVKGTTSTIQTQLNGKQATLTNPITGTGTTNKIPKFTGTTALGNSLVSDDGTTVTVEGLLAATKSVAAGYATTSFTNLASNGYVQHQFTVAANVANLQYAPTLFYRLVTNEANTPIILAPNSTTALTVLPSGASTFASTLQATRLGLGAAPNLASYLNVIANTATVGQLYLPPSAVDYTGTLSGMLWNNTSEWKFYDGVLSSVNRLIKINGNSILANSNPLNVVTSTGTGGNLGTLKAEVAFSRYPTAVSYTVLLTDVGFGWIIAVTNTAAARTITLPLANAVPAGWQVTVKDESGGALTNNITIARAGSDTIDGATSNVINLNYGSRTVYSDGVSKWFLI